MTEGRVVTFCADDNYMEHAHVLVESLHRSNPGLHIYGRLVNTEQTVPCEVLHDNTELSTKRDLFKLAGRFDHTFFETEFSFWEKKPGQIRPNIMYSEQMAYTCHKRFDNMMHLLDQGYTSVLALDADSIVKRNLSELFDEIENHDIAAITAQVYPGWVAYYDRKLQNYVTPNQQCTGFYEEGTLGTANTETARSFWTEIRAKVEAEIDDWDIDCKALFQTYDKYRETLNIYELPRTYKDKHDHSEHSHIWSGDGIRKKQSKYLEERKKYL